MEGILEKRGPFREEHLGAAQAKLQDGKLVMAGGFGSPPEGGLFIFKNSTDEVRGCKLLLYFVVPPSFCCCESTRILYAFVGTTGYVVSTLPLDRRRAALD